VFIQFEPIFLNVAFSQERKKQFFPAWLWLGGLTLYKKPMVFLLV
jgi:hypothetical protein